MTEDEAYKVHIQYTFNAFCKVVIRHAAIDKVTVIYSKSFIFSKEISASSIQRAVLKYLLSDLFMQYRPLVFTQLLR